MNNYTELLGKLRRMTVANGCTLAEEKTAKELMAKLRDEYITERVNRLFAPRMRRKAR